MYFKHIFIDFINFLLLFQVTVELSLTTFHLMITPCFIDSAAVSLAEKDIISEGFFY